MEKSILLVVCIFSSFTHIVLGQDESYNSVLLEEKRLIFNENFDNNDNKWLSGYNQDKVKISGGKLVLGNMAKNGFVYMDVNEALNSDRLKFSKLDGYESLTFDLEMKVRFKRASDQDQFLFSFVQSKVSYMNPLKTREVCLASNDRVGFGHTNGFKFSMYRDYQKRSIKKNQDYLITLRFLKNEVLFFLDKEFIGSQRIDAYQKSLKTRNLFGPRFSFAAKKENPILVDYLKIYQFDYLPSPEMPIKEAVLVDTDAFRKGDKTELRITLDETNSIGYFDYNPTLLDFGENNGKIKYKLVDRLFNRDQKTGISVFDIQKVGKLTKEDSLDFQLQIDYTQRTTGLSPTKQHEYPPFGLALKKPYEYVKDLLGKYQNNDLGMYELAIDEDLSSGQLNHKWINTIEYGKKRQIPLEEFNKTPTLFTVDEGTAISSLDNWILTASLEKYKHKPGDYLSFQYYNDANILAITDDNNYILGSRKKGTLPKHDLDQITIKIINSIDDLNTKLFVNEVLIDSVEIVKNYYTNIAINRGSKTKTRIKNFQVLKSKDYLNLHAYSFYSNQEKFQNRRKTVDSLFIFGEEKRDIYIEKLKNIVSSGDRIAKQWLNYFTGKPQTFLGLAHFSNVSPTTMYTNSEINLLDILFYARGKDECDRKCWDVLENLDSYLYFAIPVIMSGILDIDLNNGNSVFDKLQRKEEWIERYIKYLGNTPEIALKKANNIYLQINPMYNPSTPGLISSDTTGFSGMIDNYDIALRNNLISKNLLRWRCLVFLSSDEYTNNYKYFNTRNKLRSYITTTFTQNEIREEYQNLRKYNKRYADRVENYLTMWGIDSISNEQEKARALRSLTYKEFGPAIFESIIDGYGLEDKLLMSFAESTSSVKLAMQYWRIVMERDSEYTQEAKENYEYHSLYTKESISTTTTRSAQNRSNPKLSWETRNKTTTSTTTDWVTIRRSRPYHPPRKNLEELFLVD